MRLPNASVRRRFFRLTCYNILANVTAPLVGLVDVAMLGHLAEIRFLAGVALGGVVFDLLYWSFGFLRMGTTGTTAQALGRAQAGRAERSEVFLILGRFMLLALAVAALLFAARSLIGDLSFALLSGEPGVEAAGREYFDARILGVPAALANLVFIGWFLGREESRRVLVMTVVANLANVALNYVLILRLGLATRGAGLASAASQYLMLAIAVWLYSRSREPVRWSWQEILDRRRWREMASLNTDIVIRTLFLVGCFALFTNLSSLLGVVVLAANALLLRIFTVATLIIDGAAFAIESLAGIFHGAGSRGELRRVMRLGLAVGIAFAAAFLVAIILAPKAILGLLTSHVEVVELASALRWWLVPVLLFGAAAYLYDGLFIGLTAGRPLRNAMLFSSFGAFLPVALLSLALESAHLLWLALAVFMLARVVTLEIARRDLPAFAPQAQGDPG